MLVSGSVGLYRGWKIFFRLCPTHLYIVSVGHAVRHQRHLDQNATRLNGGLPRATSGGLVDKSLRCKTQQFPT